MPDDEIGLKSVPMRDLSRTRAENFLFIHSNSASVAETFWDIMLIFGAVVPPVGEDTPVIEERVGVSMSWEHAKALYKLLGGRIEAFERAHDIALRDPAKPKQSATPQPNAADKDQEG